MFAKTLSLFVAYALVVAAAAPGAYAADGCPPDRWVGAWTASPSDASRGSDVADIYDASGNMKSVTRNETARAILTPTLGGSEVRVRLSNRFRPAPVRFDRVTIARRSSDAAVVPESVAPLTFGGSASVVADAGRDVVSDPVSFAFEAFQSLAVSVYVPDDVGKPTNHSTARQTSYLTPEDAGDHTGDGGGEAFTQKTTMRPFVTGIEVKAPGSAGAVVTLGDSITDGYQGQPAGIPETTEGIDADGRWPDVLARRLLAAGRPLSVLNAGISGNRVLRDGLEGGNRDTYGPAALNRVDADVLQQAGVTTVVLLEGINDLGQAPNDPPAAIIAGYERLIGRLRAAGLRVLHGTLTPAFGASGQGYGSAAADAKRNEINNWIRSKSPADAIIDFDAVVRDPADPRRINPGYDGSDHLHFNLAGNKALGEAVPLEQLAAPACAGALPPFAARPKVDSGLSVRVSPRRVRAGRTARLRIVVRRQGRPLRGARVTLGRFRATTNAAGVVRLRVRLKSAGRRTLFVRARGSVAVRVRVRVRVRGA